LGHLNELRLGFITAATSLNGSQPNFAQCLAVSYIFGGSCPVTEFCQVQHSLCVQVLRFPILAALLHGTRVVVVSQLTAALSRGRDLYSEGRPSRWALAHILVLSFFFMAALCNRGPLYFCPVISLLSIYLLFSSPIISAATDWMSTILLHMAWP